MAEADINDDPFERAARKERQARLREEYANHVVKPAPGMLGFTAAWAVVLALHAWLTDNADGFLFRSHLIVFILWSAITAGVVVKAIADRFLR